MLGTRARQLLWQSASESFGERGPAGAEPAAEDGSGLWLTVTHALHTSRWSVFLPPA